MKVAVVIVNYRTASLTIDCLMSIAADGWLPANGRVIVVDNASGDDSCDVLGKAIQDHGWSDWTEVVAAERNGGFAYGNNVGIRRALQDVPPEYVLLLNPDTVVRSGAVETLVRFMEGNPKAGICGGRLLDAEGAVAGSGFRFPTIPGEFESGIRLGLMTRLLRRWVVSRPASDTPAAVDWVSGAFFLVRREVLSSVGMLDKRFFMYYEEVDFCKRATAAGWEVWHVPAAQVVHLEGAASGIRQQRRRRPKYWYESRRRYFVKNHGVAYALLAELAYDLGYASWRMRRMIQRKPDTDPLHRLWDGLRHVVLPALTDKGG